MSLDLMAPDLQDGRMLSSSPLTANTTPILAIRLATTDDIADVARLAALDQKPMPSGRVLLGVVDGRTEAAVSVETGHAVANPFAPTADVVALLRHRANRLRGELTVARPSSVLRGLRSGRRRRLTSTA
jgi:hypothetical protein